MVSSEHYFVSHWTNPFRRLIGAVLWTTEDCKIEGFLLYSHSLLSLLRFSWGLSVCSTDLFRSTQNVQRSLVMFQRQACIIPNLLQTFPPILPLFFESCLRFSEFFVYCSYPWVIVWKSDWLDPMNCQSFRSYLFSFIYVYHQCMPSCFHWWISVLDLNPKLWTLKLM